MRRFSLAASALLAVLPACGGGTGQHSPSDDAGPDSGAEAAVDGVEGASDVEIDAATDAGTDDANDAATVGDADAATADARADAQIERLPAPKPYDRPVYQRLSETGLFAGGDTTTRLVPDAIMAFEPTHKLWSDGASKRRWVRLPPGTQIDTSDMNHWIFPVGTKFWKEFSLGGVLLETRLIERYGVGPEDYWMGAFVWSADQSDATLAVDGQDNINGTAHDAPAQKVCGDCHRGDAGRVLGLSAVQMSRPDLPPNLGDLAARDLLSVPPPAGASYAPPGDATTAAALGYLHANCGHCHNESGIAWSDAQMVLRLTTTDRDAATSGPFLSIVDKPITYWRGGAITRRIVPGDPAQSGLIVRMMARGNKDAMPQLATELVDSAGVDLVSHWITSLPH